MRTTQTILFGGLVVIGVAGLSLSQDNALQSTQPKLVAPHEAQTPAPAGSLRTNVDYPVIGYLEKRGRTITIKAGPKGALYSVKEANGKVLCENATAEQLQAKAPQMAEFLRNAVAGSSGVTADARIRVHDSAIR